MASVTLSQLTVLFFCLSNYATCFTWENCGGDGSMLVNQLRITPHPIELPGKIRLTVDAEHASLDTSDIDARLNIQWKFSLFGIEDTVEIPCVKKRGKPRFGSCTWKKICRHVARVAGHVDKSKSKDSLDLEEIEKELKKKGVFTSCEAGEVNVVNKEIDLPAAPIAGKFKVKIEILDSETQALKLCLLTNFELKLKNDK